MARTPSQRGQLANQRGKIFERKIAQMLFNELGITFVRELEQVRKSGLSDLIPDDENFPFALELKKRRKGVKIPDSAWEQAVEASDIDRGIYPAVIYGYDRYAPRALVPFSAIAEMETGLRTKNIHDKADISLPCFCKLVREIMAWRAEKNDL